jgi:hypothetical protein
MNMGTLGKCVLCSEQVNCGSQMANPTLKAGECMSMTVDPISLIQRTEVGHDQQQDTCGVEPRSELNEHAENKV